MILKQPFHIKETLLVLCQILWRLCEMFEISLKPKIKTIQLLQYTKENSNQ